MSEVERSDAGSPREHQHGHAGDSADTASAHAPATSRDRRRMITRVGAAMLGLAGAGAAQSAISVEVGGADWAADDVVAQENMFNASAPDGKRYVMVPITVSNMAPDAIAPRAALHITYRSDDGRVFSPERQVVPDDLDEIAPLGEGETATGNVLFALPEHLEGNGEWVIEPSSGHGEGITFTAM